MNELTLEEEQLQKVLVETYFANLEFLKEYDNNLYERIESLSLAINNGIYKERYLLEFIKEKGDFDIYDSVEEKYLYGKKPKFINQKLVDGVKLDKNSFFSSLTEKLYNKELTYEKFNLDYESFEELRTMLVNEIKSFTDILKEDFSEDKEFKKVDKFLFIGTLLGRHISPIHKKIRAKNYFVCENNLEIFRLSLFLTSYVELAQNSNVRFSIMDDEATLMYKFQVFLEDNPYENYYLKFVTTDYNVRKLFNPIISTMYKASSITFDYTRILHNLFKLTCEKINKNKILNIQKNAYSFDTLKNKPVLFVASGPSLELNLEWLKTNHKKFIIVAIGGSYKKLLSNDIIPDIVSTIDASYKDLSKYQFSSEDIKKIQNTIVLASLNSPTKICEKFNQNLLFYFEMYFALKENSRVYTGYSVAEITVAMLLHMGASEIYLLGTDLAINPETGETHMSNYHNSREAKVSNSSSLLSESVSFREELIPVRGNLCKEVLTTRVFSLSIFAYSMAINVFKKEEQRMYNLCQNGAYLEGVEPTEIEKLDLSKYNELEKVSLIKQISEEFVHKADFELNNIEKEFINEEIRYFSKLKDKVSINKDKGFDKFEEFNEFFKSFQKEMILINRQTYLNLIFKSYFSIINSYINYCFNSKKVKNESFKVRKVSTIWLGQVEAHMENYINYLKSI